ncbi:MAG: type IV pilus assembly protein PilB [Saprospiraceae bacterium]|jgi:type IV pilus assembly protein PilB
MNKPKTREEKKPKVLFGLAKQIVTQEIASFTLASQLQSEAEKAGHTFFEQCFQHEDINKDALLQLAANEAGMALIDLNSVNLDALPLALLSDELITKFQMLPLFGRGDMLNVAIGSPHARVAISQARFQSSKRIKAVVCDPNKLRVLITKLAAGANEGALDDFTDDVNLNEIDIDLLTDDGNVLESMVNLDQSNPIVRYVNQILRDAVTKGASDIHIEPYEHYARIRYRIDGVLHPAGEPPIKLAQNIASRIKVMSRLDIAERRLPQDGRIKLNFSRSRTIDFRVSTMPTVFGEKVVLRILNQGSTQLSLDSLGMEMHQLAQYKHATAQPHGMVLVTGPTGSGKTVSLYSALALLNNPTTNISSVEDPVEIYADGVNQVTINEKSGLTFARTLRALLRQDPDILMIGEIRDLETAEIAIKASQTGHLVLSTLHTNDAPSSITRLLNMGIAPFNIASTVNLVIAQRLVRRLCASCKQKTKISAEILLKMGFTESQVKTGTIHEAVGCSNCSKGYRGRTGIFEVMPISDATSELVMDNATEAQITRQVRSEGVLSIKEEGFKKVATGITSIAEIERVTKG